MGTQKEPIINLDVDIEEREKKPKSLLSTIILNYYTNQTEHQLSAVHLGFSFHIFWVQAFDIGTLQ